MKKVLTEAESRMYNIIIDYIEENRIPPTYRELLELTGYKSLSTVYDAVNRLARKGYIEMDPGCARTMRVVGL